MKAFLICPVRGHSMEESRTIVEGLEMEGIEVYWPPRDTDQDDPTGYDICLSNAIAIGNADVVYMVWDGKSQGCLFDAGMAFALGKRLVVLGCPPETDGKSFQNMFRTWATI